MTCVFLVVHVVGQIEKSYNSFIYFVERVLILVLFLISSISKNFFRQFLNIFNCFIICYIQTLFHLDQSWFIRTTDSINVERVNDLLSWWDDQFHIFIVEKFYSFLQKYTVSVLLLFVEMLIQCPNVQFNNKANHSFIRNRKDMLSKSKFLPHIFLTNISSGITKDQIRMHSMIYLG